MYQTKQNTLYPFIHQGLQIVLEAIFFSSENLLIVLIFLYDAPYIVRKLVKRGLWGGTSFFFWFVVRLKFGEW